MHSETNPQQLTLQKTWAFFLPLTLSWIMMFASQPIIQSGLARLPSPELILAAYAMAFYAAILLESPILMVLPTANALVCDDIAHRRTRTWILCLSALLSLNGMIIAYYTPLYNIVFRVILGSPADIAQAAQPALKILVVWPMIVAIRLYYQGVLVRFGQTRIVSFSTGVRLIAMLIALNLGMRFVPHWGVVLGAGIMLFGVAIDGLITVIAARRLLLQGVLPSQIDDPPPASRELRAFARFFLPLALTSCLHILSQPLLLGGIARSYQPTLALAAYPVGVSTMWLFSGHLRMIQQVVLSLIKDQYSLRIVRTFWLLVTGGVFILVSLIAFTPLLSLYHQHVIGLQGDILTTANRTVQLLMFIPILFAAQSTAQAVLIKARQTLPVNIAALCNLLFAVTLLYTLALTTTIPGYILAATVLSIALLCEVLILIRWARPHINALWPD